MKIRIQEEMSWYTWVGSWVLAILSCPFWFPYLAFFWIKENKDLEIGI